MLIFISDVIQNVSIHYIGVYSWPLIRLSITTIIWNTAFEEPFVTENRG